MGTKAAIPALTGLRFVAAGAVLLFHYQQLGVLSFAPLIRPLVSFGANGVDLFFVLSGYVLAYNYLDWFRHGIERRGAFLRARVARISPLYLLSLVAATPLALTVTRTWFPDVPPAVLAAGWLVTAAHLQAWLPLPGIGGWNPPSWSVSTEMFFYWLFPPIAFGFLRRLTRPRSYLVLAGVAYLAGGAFLGLATIVEPGRIAGTAHLAPFRLAEFVVGCCLGARRLRLGQTLGRRDPLILLVGLGFVAAAYLPRAGIIADIDWYVFALPLSASLVALLGAGPSRLGLELSRPSIVALGEASYALYLFQYPAILLAAALMGGVAPVWLAPVLTVGLIALSLGSHQFYERPLRRWLRGRPAESMARTSEPTRDLYPAAPIAG